MTTPPKAPRSGPTGGSRTRAKLTKEKANEIFILRPREGVPHCQSRERNSPRVAKYYRISPKAVRDIWNRHTWREVITLCPFRVRLPLVFCEHRTHCSNFRLQATSPHATEEERSRSLQPAMRVRPWCSSVQTKGQRISDTLNTPPFKSRGALFPSTFGSEGGADANMMEGEAFDSGSEESVEEVGRMELGGMALVLDLAGRAEEVTVSGQHRQQEWETHLPAQLQPPERHVRIPRRFSRAPLYPTASGPRWSCQWASLPAGLDGRGRLGLRLGLHQV